MEKILCGVDLGGTKLSIGLVSRSGEVIEKITVYDHRDKNEAEVVSVIVSIIRQLLSSNGLTESDLEGIGVGFPGHVRYRDGITITTSNLPGFRDYPLRQALGSNFSVPVLLDNDANAQALCEHRFGAGKGYDSLIFLTVSTGIGAGIILSGRLYRGMTGTAGEFGHTIVDAESSQQCTCGNKGCLMACSCGLALPYIFRKKQNQGIRTTLDLPDDFDYSKVDGRLLRKGLEINDPLSTAVISECADYIGIGVYNIFQVFNPPLIILGGGLMSWGEFYLERVKQKFSELARNMIFDNIDIVLSGAGADAGLIGAAALLTE